MVSLACTLESTASKLSIDMLKGSFVIFIINALALVVI
jgi:hypothetical protein